MTRARRPRPPQPPNPHALRASGDRWLFGYADVVTLLFACFAMLYASQVVPAAVPDPPPATVAAEVPEPAPIPVPDPATAPATEPAPEPGPSALEQALETVLGRDGNLPGIEVAASTRGLVVSLPEAGSFPAGRAELSEPGRAAMLDLAAQLRTVPNVIRVEGHTDDVPIHTPQFNSNWELSTARATTVVQFLIDAGRLDPTRLSAAGYAEYRPRLPNDSPESRARNRRVDIVVLDPATAGREEPQEAPQ
jgi:chemotaxis protein MotB